MGNILAIAGAKQSGKTTTVNFLHGVERKSCGFIKEFLVNSEGQLVVNATYLDANEKEYESMGVFDVFQDNPRFTEYAQSTFWPFIKGYNFADPLKRMLMVMFGLSREQVYGSNEQKNSLTEVRWENMPGVITPKDIEYMEHDNKVLAPYNIKDLRLTQHAEGAMTARELMQYFGTDIMRKIKDNVWPDLCLNQIKQDNSNLAVIGDCRFKNEIDAVQTAGGKVIGLTKNAHASDGHASEQIANYLDDCDYVVDNENMTIEEQCQAVLEKVKEWGYSGI